MPRGDGTGPQGAGAMTGWGRGYCAGVAINASASGDVMPGRGFGGRFARNGSGSGAWGDCRGRRNRCFTAGQTQWNASGNVVPQPSINLEREKQVLENKARSLKGALDNIDKRLAEIALSSDKP